MGVLGRTLSASHPQQRQQGATYALRLLTLINLLNFADRYVPNAVKGLIQADLDITDAESSLPTMGMILVYMVCAVLFGWFSDMQVLDRRILLAVGIAIWSVATSLAGLANNLLSLVLFRSLVGVGEAAYATIAPPMIADYFPERQRGSAYSVYSLAGPIGGALGFGIGATVGAAWGWRSAYLFAGCPGLLAAFAVLHLNDPVRGINDDRELVLVRSLSTIGAAPPGADSDDSDAHAGDSTSKPPLATKAAFWTDMALIVKNRHWSVALAGLTANNFALGGLAEWYASFLLRYKGIRTAEAGITVGAITVLGGVSGNLLGLHSARRLETWGESVNFLVAAVYTIPGAFFCRLAVSSVADKKLVYLSLYLSQVCFFTSMVPLTTLTMSVLPVRLRARASGVQIFIMHILGDVISPPIIGFISDSAHDLQVAMQVIWMAILLAGLFWFAGWFCLPRLPPVAHAVAVATDFASDSDEAAPRGQQTLEPQE